VLYEPGMSCQLYVCVNFVHYVMLLLANKWWWWWWWLFKHHMVNSL